MSSPIGMGPLKFDRDGLPNIQSIKSMDVQLVGELFKKAGDKGLLFLGKVVAAAQELGLQKTEGRGLIWKAVELYASGKEIDPSKYSEAERAQLVTELTNAAKSFGPSAAKLSETVKDVFNTWAQARSRENKGK